MILPHLQSFKVTVNLQAHGTNAHEMKPLVDQATNTHGISLPRLSLQVTTAL
jgi:hypothetical protein